MQHILKECESLSGMILIDGMLQKSSSQELINVINPATGKHISDLANCNSNDVQNAVTAADRAFLAWKNITGRERGKYLLQCADALEQHKEIIAQIMSLETGKALRTESLVEFDVFIDTLRFYGGLGSEIKGQTIPYSPQMLTITIREPIGVVGAIIPWNVPLMLMAMKIAPALVAGNCVVLKTSPEASFCILKVAQIIGEILPKGTLNIITGAADTGKSLVSHPKVKKITFTGSVESGRSVYTSSAEKIIPVTLELGGKSPMIICADADLDKAVLSVYDGMRFTRQGQSCSAASRVFIHESLHDSFIEKLLHILNSKIIGDPMDLKTDIGTVISKKQFDKINQFIEMAKADKSLKIHQAFDDVNLPKNGLFVKPTIISAIKNSHQLCQQEIFGPVLCLLKWNDFEQALQEANDSEFGLAAGIWTRDIQTALSAAHRLNAGFVQVNQYMVFRPSISFGGFGNSGIGKEGTLQAMIDNFTKEKTIIINLV